MVTVPCKCGKTAKTFLRLTFNDFPNGFTADCCEELMAISQVQAKPESPKSGKKKKK